MDKKLLTEHYYAGTIYGDMECNALIEMLDKAKKDVELLYPEVLTNGYPMRVEFDYEDGDLVVNIIYHRHESDYEYELRREKEREKELKAKAANTMELRKKIDANMEETITYLKSIGAI